MYARALRNVDTHACHVYYNHIYIYLMYIWYIYMYIYQFSSVLYIYIYIYIFFFFLLTISSHKNLALKFNWRFVNQGQAGHLNWASLVAQLVKNQPAMQKTWVWSLGWEKGKTTHSSILAWRIPWPEWNSPWGHMGFLGGASVKEPACQWVDAGLVLRSGRSPGGGHGNPL